MGGHSIRKYGMYQSFQAQNAHECDFNRNPITVVMKISVKTQYLCVQNVLIMLGLRLGVKVAIRVDSKMAQAA
jgi:hypothetical protein